MTHLMPLDLADLRAAPRLFIYGAGEGGRTFRRVLQSNRLPLAGFITSDRSGDVDGVPLYSLDRYVELRRPDDVIAVASSFEREIAAHLTAHGITTAVSASPYMQTVETAAWGLRSVPDAAQYALDRARQLVSLFDRDAVGLPGATIVEIGPGTDLSVPLLLASQGANVIVADRFPVPWDDGYHPQLYAQVLESWTGPNGALRAALEHRRYDGLLTILPQGCETLSGIECAAADAVISVAVLEHVADHRAAVRELARISKSGCRHYHWVDFRDHRNFAAPLDHLLMSPETDAAFRASTHGVFGTQLRGQELLEIFIDDFWIGAARPSEVAEADYLAEFMPRLRASKSSYRDWPSVMLRSLGMKYELVRKAPDKENHCQS